MLTTVLEKIVQTLWKAHPVRILGDTTSTCCKVPAILAQTTPYGWVDQYCSKCFQKVNCFSEYSFQNLRMIVVCPKHKQKMESIRVEGMYGFICPECRFSIKLADLIPDHQDL
ncbi:hypothetical protein KJ068_18115 [bacterium]|nr:hypothetical protein [bacterium]